MKIARQKSKLLKQNRNSEYAPRPNKTEDVKNRTTRGN